MSDTINEEYDLYVANCHAEECEPHPVWLWEVHGEPTGPLG